MTEEAAGEVARKTLELGSLGQQNVLGLSMCLSVNGGERERRACRSGTSPCMACPSEKFVECEPRLTPSGLANIQKYGSGFFKQK